MAKIPGLNISAPVVPLQDSDAYPSHYAQYGQGGWREVADIAARNAIPATRREAGMAVFVTAENALYILNNDLITWSIFKTPSSDSIRKTSTFNQFEPLGDGEIVEYVGITDQNYTNGFFYKYNGTNQIWERTDVQPAVNKVDTASIVYGTDNQGNQATIIYDSTATASTIVQRDSNSQVLVAETPTLDGHAASKKYVDDVDESTRYDLHNEIDAEAEARELADQDLDDRKVEKNEAITAATHTKITYDSKGLVTGGTDIVAADVTDLTATASEINQLHGSNISNADLAKLHDISATAAEINQLHNSQVVTEDLTKLHEVTADANELNILDGATLTTTELNYVDGVTSPIQIQLDNKVTRSSSASQIYATAGAGVETTLTYSTSAAGSTVAQRDSNAQINVAQTPTADSHAASKKYVDDRVNSAIAEAVVFKGIVADQTELPSTGNTNGDMYWIQTFVTPAPSGIVAGRSGSAIYKGAPENRFEYTQDAIYQPDTQTIILNGNGQLSVQVSAISNNAITVQTDGLHVDISGKVDKTTTASRVYGTDASGNQITYDYNTFGKVDDVQLNGVTVVTNKIANIEPEAADIAYTNEQYPTMQTLQDAIDKLLYITPSVTLKAENTASNVYYEIGTTKTSTALTWTWNKNIRTQSLNQSIGSLDPALGSYTYTTSYTTDKTFTITGSDGTTTKTSSVNVKFIPKRYWGVSTETSLTDEQILVLSGELSTNRIQSRIFDCSGGKYFYFVIRTAYCDGILFKVGGLGFSDMDVITRNVVNAQGYSAEYNIYRVHNLQTGSAISVEVL